MASLAAAEEAIDLANAYGVADGHPLSESQEITLRNGLGERADGSWAASRIADFGPRQGTGKNDKIAARELAGLLLFGEQLIIHTAHEFPTANESFLRLVSVFENWDDLRRRVARIRYANGEQGIELLTGQRLKYRARTGGSGRGFAKADLIVYDEAQHLAREHIAASGPAKLANPNSQSWFAGSGGLKSSSVAWRIRRDSLSGSGGRLAYTEMTGETVVGGELVASPDPLDRDVWYETIPGLGRWVTEEGVAALYDELGPELFLREVLCVWEPEENTVKEAGPIDLDVFAGLTQVNVEYDKSTVVLAVDVAFDRSWSSIGAVGVRPDGLVQCKVVAMKQGTGWVAGRVAELCAELGLGSVVMAKDEALADEVAKQVTVVGLNGAEQAKATQKFIDACSGVSPLLRHRGEPALLTALALAVPKAYGDGNTDFSRRNSDGDISPLKALTMAYGYLGTDDGDGPSEYEDREMTVIG